VKANYSDSKTISPEKELAIKVRRCSRVSASDDNEYDNYGNDDCGASNSGCVDVEPEGNKPASLNKVICIYVLAKDETTNCVQVHFACSDWTHHACSSNDSAKCHVSDYT